MKQAILVCALLAVPAIHAQSFGNQWEGHGSVFMGVGSNAGGSTALSAGGGFEGFLWKNLATGADIVYNWPTSAPSNGIGLLAVNGSWYFRDIAALKKVAPFVTVGYGLAFRNGTVNLINYGGGAIWWFTDEVGFRAEVRNFQSPTYGRFDTSFRFGVSIRGF